MSWPSMAACDDVGASAFFLLEGLAAEEGGLVMDVFSYLVMVQSLLSILCTLLVDDFSHVVLHQL